MHAQHHPRQEFVCMIAELDDERQLSVTTRLACGALAGTTGQTVAYPLDVVRRRLQVWPQLWSCTRETIKLWPGNRAFGCLSRVVCSLLSVHGYQKSTQKSPVAWFAQQSLICSVVCAALCYPAACVVRWPATCSMACTMRTCHCYHKALQLVEKSKFITWLSGCFDLKPFSNSF